MYLTQRDKKQGIQFLIKVLHVMWWSVCTNMSNVCVHSECKLTCQLTVSLSKPDNMYVQCVGGHNGAVSVSFDYLVNFVCRLLGGLDENQHL